MAAGIYGRFRSDCATRSVMPALVAGIHVFAAWHRNEDVDGRDKPGHDAELVARYGRNIF